MKHLLKSTNWVYGLLISLIGFSQGCSVFGGGAKMYGPPAPPTPSNSAQITIQGKVVDDTNASIPNIKVFITGDYQPMMSTTTNVLGKYTVTTTSESNNINYKISFRDEDGPKSGGEFLIQTEEVEFKSDDFSNDDMYLKGASKKEVNTVMQKKSE